MSIELARPAGFRMAFEPRDQAEARVLAKVAVESKFFAVKSEAEALIVLMVGRELGLSAMQALRGVYVVQGRPVISSDTIVAAVMMSGAAEYWQLLESTPLRCVIETKRKGAKDSVKQVWTIEDAERAKLTSKDIWKSYPADMLRHRCSAVLGRSVYPDILLGCYVPGELDEAKNHAPQVDLATVARYRSDSENEAPQWFAGAARSWDTAPTCEAHKALREKALEAETIDQAEQVFLDYRQDILDQTGGDADALTAAQNDVIICLEGIDITCRTELKKRWQAHVRAKAEATRVASPVLKAFKADVDEVELPGEAVDVWLKHKKSLAETAPATKREAWAYLCQCVTAVGNHDSAASAETWLKKAITEGTRPDPKPPNGGEPKPEAPMPSDDPERESIVAEGNGAATMAVQVKTVPSEQERFVAYLAGIDHAEHICNGVAAHEAEYNLPADLVTRLAVERMVTLGKNAMNAVNALAVARKRKRSKAA